MQYQLRVVKNGSAPQKLELDAFSELEARKSAEQQGYTVLRATAKGMGFSVKNDRFPLMLFCQELRVLLEAGLALPDALDTLSEKEHHTQTRAHLQSLVQSVREGKQLSDAMANIPPAFPELFIATVRAAETTGNLPEALKRYAAYLEQIDVLKRRIISASIYPALVLTFGFLVVIFLLTYVVPKFSRIYESHAHHVSFATELLLKIGKFSQHYGLLVLGAIAILIMFAIRVTSLPSFRAKLLDKLWHIPYLGEKIKIYHLSRLYRTFSMLLKSGIPVVSGLGMVNKLLGSGLQKNLSRAKQMISEGQPFSESFAKCDLSTPVALRLFRVGERTGELEGMMERAAVFHEEQMMRWVDAFTKLFEPLMMTALGLVIGGIVLMMYMPIFELASTLQ
jgi:general secretion pathway protein F